MGIRTTFPQPRHHTAWTLKYGPGGEKCEKSRYKFADLGEKIATQYIKKCHSILMR